MKAGRRVGFALIVSAALVLSGASGPFAVTEVAAQQADPALQADSSTTGPGEEQVDSTRLRVLRQLEALSRPAGADSLRLARDSAALAERTATPGSGGTSTSTAVGPRDSLSTSLRELTGYAITTYDGDSAEFEAADRRLILRGTDEERPRVSREGMSLSADSAIVYEEQRERVRAVGRAEYTPQLGDPVASRTMVLDLSTQRGSALGARTRYDQGGTEWIVDGDLPSVESELVYGSSTSFTSCDLEEPHYHFEAGQVKIHQGNILVARPVLLYFADVPVAWLPFIAQSLAQGRASGLLTPRFSVNDIVRTSQGYSRRISNVGFFWAMSQYSDATFALDWFSDQFTAVTGQLRYRWARQFLNGSLNYRHFWSAGGGIERALDTRHRWEVSERTRLSADVRWASSSTFVRENSFDPREVTQSIRSEGGLSHRFDWGSLNVGANRQHYLSDDRKELTLPSVGLSLSPITLLQATPSQASWYNNITWTGSGNFRRQSRDYQVQELDPETFEESKVDQIQTQASASSSFSLGNFSVSQNGSYGSTLQKGIPDFVLNPLNQGGTDGVDPVVQSARTSAGLSALAPQVIDLQNEEITWSGSASYQQRLIGSTTITPRVQISSRAIRSDTLSASSGFVSAPMRTSFGARLKTDVYGFFPGAGSFEQIRHKISPGVSYDYSPEVVPTDLQRQIFGSGEIQTRSVVTLNFNQTFEAKLSPEASEEARARAAADSAAAAEAAADSLVDAAEIGAGGIVDGGFGEQDALVGQAQGGAPSAPGGGRGQGRGQGLPSEGFERVDNGETVTLLGLQTSAVTYDFVEADSTGTFIGGFQTTQLQNSIRSDYLRGLTIQTTHDLFETTTGDGGSDGGTGSGGGAASRRFAPHLSSVNLGFSLDSSSGIFRWLGLGGSDGSSRAGAGGQAGAGAAAAGDDEQVGATSSDAVEIDESSVVPGQASATQGGPQRDPGVGRWTANLSYSLQRPRNPELTGSQMLQVNMGFQPTEHWDVRWSTSYDLNRGGFNDHIIRLTRDLHRWQANFDFLQTATGNWSFRFSVSLLDNRDLEFDYEQRSPLNRQ